MPTQIIVALISATSSVVVAFLAIYMNNRLVSYKVDELSKRVEEHNGVVLRTAVLERDIQTVFWRYDELKGDIAELKESQQQSFNEILELIKEKHQ